MRALIDLMPVFALGLAALIETAQGKWLARVAGRDGGDDVLAVHGMLAYWRKTIPYDGTSFHEYLDSFRTGELTTCCARARRRRRRGSRP